MGSYYIIILLCMAFSWLVGKILQSKMAKFSKTPLSMTGAQAAAQMLRQYRIDDVSITVTDGHLTDHYNPANKTVNLSKDVYQGANVAAVAVAAHEVGHAVQHAKGYAWLQFRSAMVPAVSFGTNISQLLLGMGLLLAIFSGNVIVLGIGIVFFSLAVVFSFVTLPVEFDASKRALVWMAESGGTGHIEMSQAKSALNWAAMTYVIAALAAVGQLLYYVLIFLNSRR